MKYITILSMSIFLSSCCWLGHCQKNDAHKKNVKALPELEFSMPVIQPPAQWMPDEQLEKVMKDFPKKSESRFIQVQ